MLRLRFIERPITDTIRPHVAAASITCWIRWMCEANDVTITRPCAWRTMSRRAAPTVRSDGVVPAAGRPGGRAARRRGVGGAGQGDPPPPAAGRPEPVEVGRPPVDRRL